MLTRKFLLALVERALKTFAQAAAALLVADGAGLVNTDWLQLVSVAGMATLVSVLTSVATGIATDGGPSIGNVEELAPVEVADGPDEQAEPVG